MPKYGIPADATGPSSYDTGLVSDLTGIDTGDVSLVQQQFVEEVDINTIVRRFGLTSGMSLPAAVGAGVYGDFTGIQDYDDAVAQIEKARAQFMSLPAPLREKFDNDPGKMIAFAQAVPESEFVAFTSPEDVPPIEPPVAAPESGGES